MIPCLLMYYTKQTWAVGPIIIVSTNSRTQINIQFHRFSPKETGLWRFRPAPRAVHVERWMSRVGVKGRERRNEWMIVLQPPRATKCHPNSPDRSVIGSSFD